MLTRLAFYTGYIATNFSPKSVDLQNAFGWKKLTEGADQFEPRHRHIGQKYQWNFLELAIGDTCECLGWFEADLEIGLD